MLPINLRNRTICKDDLFRALQRVLVLDQNSNLSMIYSSSSHFQECQNLYNLYY